ncbi:phosphoesterase PA-phosphatase related protein [Paenibacillus curdlanolyticus YK9]|uniref:Phosphoesterase PA-phosphatase related protein n=1 Tax=Paenibacillus curdlanolyticus YK9 TaxID=717606 RepID=E0IDX7_9BACL|nr:phosphatase PAP2 family protein [Paenibacillus curdlanolyticus]EFM09331.1 phosphoesterase PA-phosphatase related protein [Paenibacillus curdlanolyticus YK9]
MVLFHDMGDVALYTTVVVTLFIAYGVAGNPFAAAYAFLKHLVISRRYLLHFAALAAILFVNKYEMKIENKMDYGPNFTSFFKSIEGNFVATIQHTFHNDVITTFVSFTYVVVFQAIMLASIGIYTYKSESKKMFYATCYAIMLNYLIAIPFFLFFPINEVWSYDPNVKFLMLDVFPTFETEYRALSGLNNCFPSLHTSLSVTMAVLALRSGNKRWAALVCTFAAVIIFSIFYLGIHWLIDMCGGMLLGLFASTMGMKLAQLQTVRRLPNPSLPVRAFAQEESN